MIRIRTLGSLTVSRNGTVLAGATAQPRRHAVLLLVARAGARGVGRDRLLALLWPDGEEQASRAALSQALHALRRDLGSDEAFLGVQTLRLNEALATCDVLEFEAALADEDWERAVTAYGGPFLEGFRLGGAPELDRWVDEERTHLAQRHADALERLARDASARGDATAASRWWRRAAALDPLNARVTVELMRALDAAGERAAAIQQARVYEALLEQELALPPDGDVVGFAAELRAGAPPAGKPTARRLDGWTAGEETAGRQEGTTAGEEQTAGRLDGWTAGEKPAVQRGSRRRWVFGAVGALALLLLGALGATMVRRGASRPGEVPLLAVGGIADYRAESAHQAAPITDMLATNLARIPGVQVLSRVRLLELLERGGGRLDSPADVAEAARQGGAGEMLEGGIHAITGGQLLLELRRVDLVTGSVRTAYRLEGTDVFELVERATEEVAASMGRAGVALNPGDVSTRSLVAWRFHEEGLRGFARGDFRGARQLFEAALGEDSTFAMAAFYRMRTAGALGIVVEPSEWDALRVRARQASDRERLLILGTLAYWSAAPDLGPIADTFVVRYPAELDAQFLAGMARLGHGEIAEAVPYFNRILEQDTTTESGRGRCMACEAMQQLAYAYQALDSMPRAEAIARDWIRRDGGTTPSWATLASVLAMADRPAEALAAWGRVTTSFGAQDAVFPIAVRIRSGDFAGADQAARALLANVPAFPAGWQAFWILAISLRYQRRWDEAIALGRTQLDRLNLPARRDHEQLARMVEGLNLLESGRAAASARVWDSLARHPNPDLLPGIQARRIILHYTLATDAFAAAGDRAGTARAADSTTAWAARSTNPKDWRLADHARGMRALMERDTALAIESLRKAIWSPTVGFTRSNYRLAQVLMATGQTEEAARLLRAAIRGPFDSSNLYVSHTDLHELLAEAYARLGMRDSAAVHGEWGK